MPVLQTPSARKTLIAMLFTTVKEATFRFLPYQQQVVLAQHFEALEKDPRNLNVTCNVREENGVTKVTFELSYERRIDA